MRGPPPGECERDVAGSALALARTAPGRVRLRALGPARDRPARGASARSAPGAHRERSRPWCERRTRRRARAARRPVSAPGGTSRPAHARPLPLGKAGGSSRGLSRCEACARRDARDRAGARAPAARARDPRPGSGARLVASGRRKPKSSNQGRACRVIVVVRRTDARAARDPRASPPRAGAAPDVDGRSRSGEDAPRARGDRRVSRASPQAQCSSSSAASGMRDSSPGRSSVSSGSRSGRDVRRVRNYSSICATGKRSSSSTTSSTCSPPRRSSASCSPAHPA